MADLPAISDLLNAGISTADWCDLDKVNRDEDGNLVGSLPEAQSANRPTAEFGNGVSAVIRQLSTFFRGTAEADALALADSFKLPRYTTAGRPAASAAGLMIFDTDLGAILVDNGSEWVSLSPFSADSNTLYEVDFSSLATNAFTDGTEVIDGLSWTVANSAGAGASWGIVATEGLKWAAPTSSAQTWTVAAPNAPYLYLPVSSIPNWQGGGSLVVDLYLSAMTFENGNDAVRVGLWDVIGSPAAGSTTNRARIADRGNHGGLQTIRTFDGSTVTANADTWNVNAISFRLEADCSMIIGVGTYSGGWPTFNYIQRLNTSLATDEHVLANTARLALIFINASDASPTSAVTIARMRVRRG